MQVISGPVTGLIYLRPSHLLMAQLSVDFLVYIIELFILLALDRYGSFNSLDHNMYRLFD